MGVRHHGTNPRWMVPAAGRRSEGRDSIHGGRRGAEGPRGEARLKTQQIPRRSSARAQGLVLLALLFACLGCSQESRRASKPDAEGEEACEIKVILRSQQIDEALQKLALEDAKASRRSLWFFDTRNLALFEHGVILRARKIVNGPDDATVKLRPMEEAAIAPAVRRLRGFKCEEDRNAGHAVTSCSLSA